MTSDISHSARVFLATVEFEDDPAGEYLAGFFSVISQPGMPGWVRGHRTVVLPDFQGMGIGNRMIELTAEYLWRTQRLRFRAVTAALPIIWHRLKRPHMWRLVSAPHHTAKSGSGQKTAFRRLTTSWEYIPQPEMSLNAGQKESEIFQNPVVQMLLAGNGER